VLDFWEGSYDVLCAPPSSKSGIDMPTVNTLVVDRADLLGLGQLHRSGPGGTGRPARLRLLVPPVDRVLSEQAYERLRTIGDQYRAWVGVQDRAAGPADPGAGNLLGRDQSGHIAASVRPLCQMVSEAVSELKGEPRPQPVDLSLDLPDDAAHLPASYVEAKDVRLEAYRRLTGVRTEEEVDDVRTEWEDRFGPLPPRLPQLLDVARLRWSACASASPTLA